MRYSRKHRRRIRHLTVVSCACYLVAAFSNHCHHSSVVVAGASASSGTLHPPPPPPPPSRGNAQNQKNSPLSEKPPLTHKLDGGAPRPPESLVETDNVGDDARQKPTEKITNGDAFQPIMSEKGGNYEAAAPINIHDSQQQQQPPPGDVPQYYPKNKQWNIGQTSQHLGQHYDQPQWRQQASSWDQGAYQQQPQPQPEQQHYNQQQQQYPQQQYHRPGATQQQQTGQLAIYNRRPTTPRKSAPSIFSLAVKKLQTGIDTVSETIDVDKVTSTVTSRVSSLSSRIGHIGGTISGGRLGKSSGSAHPRATQRPGNRLAASAGKGAGRGGPPPQQRQRQWQNIQYSQQRTKPPGIQQQQQQQRKQQHAPSMSELLSVRQQQASENDASDKEDTEDARDDVTRADITDGEDEDYPDITQQNQGPKQQPSSTSGGSQLLQKGPPPRGRSAPPQQQPFGGRRTQPPFSSSSPLRPRNGGSMTPPATAARGRYEDYDDDDYNSSSSTPHKFKSTLRSCIPRVPRLFKRSSVLHDDGAWSEDEAKGVSYRASSASTAAHSGGGRSPGSKSGSVPQPVQSLLDKRNTLLSTATARRCISIGRTQAVLDAAQLSLLAGSLNEVLPLFFHTLSAPAAASTIAPLAGRGDANSLRVAVLSTLLSAMDGWAPYALAAAFLLSASNKVWIQPALKSVYEEASSENAAEASYAQLYLRLMASIPMRQKSGIGETMKRTARAAALQVVSLARLRFFVALALLYMISSTVAVLRPAGAAVSASLLEVVQLQAWRNRPIDWEILSEGAKSISVSLGQSLRGLFLTEWKIVQEEPLRVAVVVSLLMTLLSVSCLPSLEWKRRGESRFNGIRDDAEEAEDDISSLWSNIGASSASRLGLLSSPHGVEGALEQWAKLRPDRARAAGITTLTGKQPKWRSKKKKHFESLDLRSSLQPFLRKMMYSVSSLLLLSAPLAIYLYAFASTSTADRPVSMASLKSIPEDGWIALSQLALLLFFAHLRVGNAVDDVLSTNALWRGHSSVSSFFRKLGETAEEARRSAQESSADANFQAMLTASPTKGISVVDLWAAHTSRRAWAVKGANIQCQNGEVVVVLGADGSGKTRLLTSIAECIFIPPKSARTTTHVRGSITVAGVDLSKWDKMQLQKRVGVFLNDVRTVSDFASLMGGCTLAEILGERKNSVSSAIEITGLGSTLARLPSKLSTVVSANEDELKPSSSRPYPSYPLSPSDWSRVLLTKVLAQLIDSNNVRPSSSSNAVQNCMVGAILLLDDATSQMSESDGANLITALRRTGAAVLLTTNCWASGRFADRIVVLDGKSGAVVESGTHADLINLGPDRSLYAREWSAMAST